MIWVDYTDPGGLICNGIKKKKDVFKYRLHVRKSLLCISVSYLSEYLHLYYLFFLCESEFLQVP